MLRLIAVDRQRVTLVLASLLCVAATLGGCSGGGSPGSVPAPATFASAAPMPVAPTSPKPTPTMPPTVVTSSAPTPSLSSPPSPSPSAAASLNPSPSPSPSLAPTPSPLPSNASKSLKRGIAYDLTSPADIAALAPGVSWWYDYATTPNAAIPSDFTTRYGMQFYPMLYNGSFDANAVVAYLNAHPSVGYILVMNEPNLVDQANLTPQQAAAIWPRYEAISAQTGVKIVGPAMTYGTLPGYADPIVWLDAFYAAYRSANARDPQIDYLAYHWYDYGLGAQLDRLQKYGKSFWVTEFANWHTSNGAQIDTLAKQEAQMTDMVATCENRADVFRYAWFAGRVSPDPHFDSLLASSGQLTELGRLYLTLPHP